MSFAVKSVSTADEDAQSLTEVVTAFIVRDSNGVTDDAVLAFCRDRLASYKRPRAVHFVDTLPRNAMGKIMRSELITSP